MSETAYGLGCACGNKLFIVKLLQDKTIRLLCPICKEEVGPEVTGKHKMDLKTAINL